LLNWTSSVLCLCPRTAAAPRSRRRADAGECSNPYPGSCSTVLVFGAVVLGAVVLGRSVSALWCSEDRRTKANPPVPLRSSSRAFPERRLFRLDATRPDLLSRHATGVAAHPRMHLAQQPVALD
jgi:hypothetical protein